MKYVTYNFYKNVQKMNEQTESTLISKSDLFYV